MKVAICPGSFDPVTIGHVDIIKRACYIFDKVIVAVMINPNKDTSFSVEERISFLKEAILDIDNIEVSSFNGLLANYAKERGATVIVKGLRAISDFEYEFQMSLANKKLNGNLETIFFSTNAQNMYLSSSMVKQIARFGGKIKDFVPESIHEKIIQRLRKGEDIK